MKKSFASLEDFKHQSNLTLDKLINNDLTSKPKDSYFMTHMPNTPNKNDSPKEPEQSSFVGNKILTLKKQ